MSGILEAVARERRKFVPSKPIEFLALQLARKLSDEEAVRFYLTLFERHPRHLLLRIYRECANEGKLTGREFVSRLRQLTNKDS